MIKTATKWLFRLLVLVILLVIGFLLLLDSLAKSLVEKQLQDYTGLDVTIGRLEVGLLNPTFRLENLIMYNAPAYGGAPMISLPELRIEYDRRALMTGRLHLRLLRVNLAELHLVEGRDGRLNMQLLDQNILAAVERDTQRRGRSGQTAQFGGIDTLNFSFGRLRYSSLKNPETKGYYNVDIDHWVLTDIKREEEIPIAFQAMAKQKGLEWLWDRISGRAAATNAIPRR